MTQPAHSAAPRPAVTEASHRNGQATAKPGSAPDDGRSRGAGSSAASSSTGRRRPTVGRERERDGTINQPAHTSAENIAPSENPPKIFVKFCPPEEIEQRLEKLIDAIDIEALQGAIDAEAQRLYGRTFQEVLTVAQKAITRKKSGRRPSGRIQTSEEEERHYLFVGPEEDQEKAE